MFSYGPPPSHVLRRSVELAFDGNHSDLVVDWLVVDAGIVRLTLEDLESMFKATSDGHLAWVCVPPEGYRL